jgi:hypothetical protein
LTSPQRVRSPCLVAWHYRSHVNRFCLRTDPSCGCHRSGHSWPRLYLYLALGTQPDEFFLPLASLEGQNAANKTSVPKCCTLPVTMPPLAFVYTMLKDKNKIIKKKKRKNSGQVFARAADVARHTEHRETSLWDGKGYHNVHAHATGTGETAAQQRCVLSIESSM